MTAGLLPNLFLIGAPKCGTSAFVEQISCHPEIFVPSEKEVLFFDRDVFYDYPEDQTIRSLDQYRAFYNSRAAGNAKYRVDGSIFIMYSRTALRAVLDTCLDSRFVMILRDPLEASKSMHLQRLKYIDRSLREVSADFCACWRLLEERRDGRGFPEGCRNRIVFRYDLLYRYELYLDWIRELIPTGRLLVIDYARFRKEPREVHRALCNFLGIRLVDLPLVSTNEAYTLAPSRLRVALGGALRATSGPRRALGLTHRRHPRLARFFDGPHLPVKRVPSPCDSEVRVFFQPALAAMQSAFASHGVEHYLQSDSAGPDRSAGA